MAGGGVQDHPMVRVSWYDCKAYADWAGLQLPTEAQWEYASRGGCINSNYPWGNGVDTSNIWCFETSNWMGTAPVERTYNVFENGYGLVDMVGNVFEWCADWYGLYPGNNMINPIGASLGDQRVLRGGSWENNIIEECICGLRARCNPNMVDHNRGFRLVFN